MSGWREIGRETLAETPFLVVNRETVATPSRPEGLDWMVVRRKQAAVIAARTVAMDYLLVRQERVAARRAFWEFAAGQIDESVVDAAAIRSTAVRELGEETGYEIGNEGDLTELGIYYSSPGFTDEMCHLFLATGVVRREAGAELDENEGIVECRAFSREEVTAMIRSGEICDANTLCCCARLMVRGIF